MKKEISISSDDRNVLVSIAYDMGVSMPETLSDNELINAICGK